MTVEAKICGLRSTDALDAPLEGGADYVGLVFFPKSPRHLTLEAARVLAERARGKAKIVALTVDPDDAALSEMTAAVAPDFIQLHGQETPERAKEISARFKRPVIKAIKVEAKEDAAEAWTYADCASLILFDAKPPPGAELPGGNGEAFDWRLLESVRGKLPFMLSGGLAPETVAEAVRITGAAAVDVSSSVETAPGQKDPELIRRFLHAAKGVKHPA